MDLCLHSTILDNSYRADDEFLAPSHRAPASTAPHLHLRRVAEAVLLSAYANSLSLTWSI